MTAQSKTADRHHASWSRFEKPTPSDLRGARPETCLIDRRLSRVFALKEGMPREMGALLASLSEKTAR